MTMILTSIPAQCVTRRDICIDGQVRLSGNEEVAEGGNYRRLHHAIDGKRLLYMYAWLRAREIRDDYCR